MKNSHFTNFCRKCPVLTREISCHLLKTLWGFPNGFCKLQPSKSSKGPFLYPTVNVSSCMICSMVYASSWYSSLISCWRSKAFIIIATHHQSIIIVLCLVLFLGGSSPWHSSVTNYAKNDTNIFSEIPKNSCIHIHQRGQISCKYTQTTIILPTGRCSSYCLMQMLSFIIFFKEVHPLHLFNP